jgi:hypothetical protein
MLSFQTHQKLSNSAKSMYEIAINGFQRESAMSSYAMLAQSGLSKPEK